MIAKLSHLAHLIRSISRAEEVDGVTLGDASSLLEMLSDSSTQTNTVSLMLSKIEEARRQADEAKALCAAAKAADKTPAIPTLTPLVLKSRSKSEGYYIGSDYPTLCLLQIRGANKLIRMGYRPYLFRLTTKGVLSFKIHKDGVEKTLTKFRGWNMFGECNKYDIVQFDREDIMMVNPHLIFKQDEQNKGFKYPDKAFYNASALVKLNNGNPYYITIINWGRTQIAPTRVGIDTPRNIRLDFAVAFGPAILKTSRKITPKDMVTPLVPFKVLIRKSLWENTNNIENNVIYTL